MPFVTELIPVEDKLRLGSSQITDSIGRPLYFYKWTIDRERDMFLLQTYRGGEDAFHHIEFILSVKGEMQRLSMICHEAEEEGGGVYPWQLNGPLPTYSRSDEGQSEILAGLREALVSFSGSVLPAKRVTFDF